MSQYVLKKRGQYYREEAKGYTYSLAEAGIFDMSQAVTRTEKAEGVEMIHVDAVIADIDRERSILEQKMAALDKAERNILGLRVNR